MAVRRINFTNRKRIHREHVTITVDHSPGLPPLFDAEIDLRDYALPGDSLVFLEAYRQTTWMRWECGVVDHIQLPEQRWMRQFETPDGVLFRIRVTDLSHNNGVLLAEADRIPFRLTEQSALHRRSLLPVNKDSTLGDLIFRLDCSAEPVLLINEKIGNWRAAAVSAEFMSLVYPSVLRELLFRIVLVDQYELDDEADDWQADWLRFALRLPGIASVPSADESDQSKLDWIDDVIAAFSRRCKGLSAFATFWNRESRT